jgi:Cu+-exporting ATPase
MKHIIHIEGMSCKHCSARVEKSLEAVSGVKSADVDLATKTATIESDDSVSQQTLYNAVTAVGYKVVD